MLLGWALDCVVCDALNGGATVAAGRAYNIGHVKTEAPRQDVVVGIDRVTLIIIKERTADAVIIILLILI